MQIKASEGQTIVDNRAVDLGTLQKNFNDARQKLLEAQTAARAAAHLETDALNEMNACQKELDEAFEMLKRTAIPRTDWHSRILSREQR